MTAYSFEHAPFEGPGAIAEWAERRGAPLVRVDATVGEFPHADAGDLLVVMGGPMGANDEVRHPWLVEEKRAIAAAIDAGASVLGVCLGGQLVARVLGAPVRRNPKPEIGWWDVMLTPEGTTDPVFGVLPERFVAGHWHGDTFGIPEGAVCTLSSEACPNQGFSVDGGRVVGLQCHLEWHADDARTLVDACGADLVPGERVVTGQEFLEGEATYGANARDAMFAFLDALMRRNG